jgi:hypothetical protein
MHVWPTVEEDEEGEREKRKKKGKGKKKMGKLSKPENLCVKKEK